MWIVSSDSEMRSGNRRFPSWSWASLNQPIFMRVPFQQNSSSILIRVLPAEALLLDNDPFGQIEGGGLLRLERPMVQTIIRPCIGIYNNGKWWLRTSLANAFADRDPFADGTTIYCPDDRGWLQWPKIWHYSRANARVTRTILSVGVLCCF